MTKYNLNMHKVNFPLQEKHTEKEKFVALWNSEEVQQFFKKQSFKPLFFLHDGPPYANGDLHLGHFTNKVLKDTLLKFKRLNGFYAPYYPGSDCHGLPVELAVEKAYGKKGEDLSTFVKKCYDYSSGQVESQQAQSQKFGVFAHYDERYKTTDYTREAGEMKAVLELLNKGLLFQKFRPVHWCKDCQSSLAEAELEYKTKQSDSLTVEFVVNESTSLLVWTTTPYTLPANQAVVYNPRLVYAKYFDRSKAKNFVHLKNNEVPENWVWVEDVSLESMQVMSPYRQVKVPVLAADFVDKTGTGFVHTAPSFGLDDFFVGEKYDLETKNYVNEYGKYDCSDFPELQGKNLKDASLTVLEFLKEKGLVYSHSYFQHEYPHCWRHKTPLFSKTSKEWFMNLSDVSQKAVSEAEAVTFYPGKGRNRLQAMLEGRKNWCVSRNRVWGVPLPFGSSKEDKQEYKAWMTKVEEKGLASLYEDENFNPQTLDVWFDSGMTHTTVTKEKLGHFKADLYLEGSDQHRGWFQSSLLTSVALNGEAPYKEVFTHGFVVDEKGNKFSKSSPNYQPLEKMFNVGSPDLYRVWSLDQDYHKDLTFSKNTLATATEKYKKFRNTFRFMLQNLNDFKVSEFNLTSVDLLDSYMLNKTNAVKKDVLKLADSYKFCEALNTLYDYCYELSYLYMDSQKDRLYCLSKNDARRKTTQSVLYYVQHTLMLLMSPFLPYSMEEYYSLSGLGNNPSVLMEEFLDEVKSELNVVEFNEVLQFREELNKQFEGLRAKKELSKNNEMKVYYVQDLTKEQVDALTLLLAKPYLVKSSQFKLEKHGYLTCDRCWNTFEKLHENGLCHSCYEAESELM